MCIVRRPKTVSIAQKYACACARRILEAHTHVTDTARVHERHVANSLHSLRPQCARARDKTSIALIYTHTHVERVPCVVAFAVQLGSKSVDSECEHPSDVCVLGARKCSINKLEFRLDVLQSEVLKLCTSCVCTFVRFYLRTVSASCILRL